MADRDEDRRDYRIGPDGISYELHPHEPLPPPLVVRLGVDGMQRVVERPAELAGRKDDQAKPRYDLIPPELLEALADVLTYGANKYGARNWERGMAWGRPFGALMRHMWAWWRGEKADAETGRSHLWHAACCLAFLIAYEMRQVGLDDRPKDGEEAGR